MAIATFFNVHKDSMQDSSGSAVYSHDEYLGLSKDAANVKYHELLAAAYAAADPWTMVCIIRDDGIMTEGDLIDRRVDPEQVDPEP